MDDFSTKFEEFSLVVFLATSATSNSVWYIDSRVSHHMAGVCKHFLDLTVRDVDLEVVLGDDSIVRVVGIGTVSFKRE